MEKIKTFPEKILFFIADIFPENTFEGHNFISLSAIFCKKYPVILRTRISQDESFSRI